MMGTTIATIGTLLPLLLPLSAPAPEAPCWPPPAPNEPLPWLPLSLPRPKMSVGCTTSGAPGGCLKLEYSSSVGEAEPAIITVWGVALLMSASRTSAGLALGCSDKYCAATPAATDMPPLCLRQIAGVSGCISSSYSSKAVVGRGRGAATSSNIPTGQMSIADQAWRPQAPLI